MSQYPTLPSSLPKDYVEPDYQLPSSYLETYLVLMVRDPECIFAYWEISPVTRSEFERNYGRESWENSRLAMRLSRGTEQNLFELNEAATNWYFHVKISNQPLLGELGRILPDQTFIVLASARLDLTIGTNPCFGTNRLYRPEHRQFLEKTPAKRQQETLSSYR